MNRQKTTYLKRNPAAGLALVLCAVLVLCGCSATGPVSSGNAAQTETASSEQLSQNGTVPAEGTLQDGTDFSGEHTFVEDLPDEDLQKPARIIKSLADYIYVLDYLAFYRVGDKVFFEIDPVFAEEIYNPYTIHQKAYKMADLADVYACQLDDSYYSEFGVIGIKYSMSRDIASEKPETVPETKIVASFDYAAAGKDDGGNEPPKESLETLSAPVSDQIPADMDKEEVTGVPSGTGKAVSCENSEQLYYLVMHGYKPEPVKGSIAETLYAEAKDVLAQHVRSDMTDFQKIKAVYDWLTTEVRYDHETAYSSETYLVKEQAYYLEGVFLNHCAVCDGKAKAYALLLNMTGVPCLRTTGVNEGGDHAWNMVELDGAWYISCATYGQADMADGLGRIVPNYSMLLAGKETPYEWYPAQKHRDIEALLSASAFDCYRQMGADDGMELKAENLEQVKELLTQTAAFTSSAPEDTGREYKVEFLYTGNDKESFQEELLTYLESLENVNAAEVPCETGTAYQVIMLKEE